MTLSSDIGDSLVGIRYSPSAHMPRSIKRHFSEQNGRCGLPSHVASSRHLGHLILVDVVISYLSVYWMLSHYLQTTNPAPEHRVVFYWSGERDRTRNLQYAQRTDFIASQSLSMLSGVIPATLMRPEPTMYMEY